MIKGLHIQVCDVVARSSAWRGNAILFCVQFVLHADMLFLQRSAVLNPAELVYCECINFTIHLQLNSRVN